MWQFVLLAACVVTVVGAQTDDGMSNEGMRFALALPPVYNSVSAELIIYSRENTAVVISYPQAVFDIVSVEINTSVNYRLHSALHCQNGVEDKAVFVISLDAPISLHLSNYDYTTARNPDSTILRPIPDCTDDIFLAGYNYGATSTSSSYRPKSFYMVVGTAEGTEVEVYHKEGDSHVLSQQFTLGRHDVFTEDAYYHSAPTYSVDFTGSFVRATKPVAVYSGHGCARVPETESDTYSRSLFASMPYFNHLGYTYVTTPYHFGADDTGAAGYEVRVISVVEDTAVFIPAAEYNGVLDAGSFYHFDYPLSRQGTPISCSQPCMVVQYAKRVGAGDSPGGRHLNPFMLVLTPKDHYSNDVHFSTNTVGGDSNTRNALSLVVDFYPVDDLYLDGVNLDYLDWTMATGETGYVATVSIESGDHELYTTDPEHRFAAYYHASYHTSSSSQMSYGYAVSYGVPRDEYKTCTDGGRAHHRHTHNL